MTCAHCLDLRASIRKAFKTLTFGTGKSHLYYLVGFYLGPHGRWHGLRFHIGNRFFWMSWKWIKPRKIAVPEDVWKKI